MHGTVHLTNVGRENEKKNTSLMACIRVLDKAVTFDGFTSSLVFSFFFSSRFCCFVFRQLFNENWNICGLFWLHFFNNFQHFLPFCCCDCHFAVVTDKIVRNTKCFPLYACILLWVVLPLIATNRLFLTVYDAKSFRIIFFKWPLFPFCNSDGSDRIFFFFLVIYLTCMYYCYVLCYYY